MEKQAGRGKKYPGTPRISVVINIINPWRETHDKIEKLSIMDDNVRFKVYCKEIEGSDLSGKGKNRLSTYIRWIIWEHLQKNLEKLK